jgi:enamine deaminase RidA (YjgF/YER057c/UK114 family)
MPTDPQALAFQTEVGFADAVVVGDMVYRSGVVAAPFPAWTAIGITALYEPTAVTEIKIVARVTPR